MTKEQMIKKIEGSDYWKYLNKKAESICNEYGQELTEEQYQALRNMLICKVIEEQ